MSSQKHVEESVSRSWASACVRSWPRPRAWPRAVREDAEQYAHSRRARPTRSRNGGCARRASRPTGWCRAAVADGGAERTGSSRAPRRCSSRLGQTDEVRRQLEELMRARRARAALARSWARRPPARTCGPSCRVRPRRPCWWRTSPTTRSTRWRTRSARCGRRARRSRARCAPWRPRTCHATPRRAPGERPPRGAADGGCGTLAPGGRGPPAGGLLRRGSGADPRSRLRGRVSRPPAAAARRRPRRRKPRARGGGLGCPLGGRRSSGSPARIAAGASVTIHSA